MNKHAYLILAHNQFDLLKKLIKLLDNEHNDIYVHLDKGAKDFDVSQFKNLTKFSHLEFIERKKLRWGNYNLVDAELRLLKAASKNKYSYYHLLSGQDLPIQSNEAIYNFFENSGKDFLSWDGNLTKWIPRFKTYHIFTDGKRNFIKKLRKFYEKLQLKLGIDRTKRSGLTYLKGDQWFSITNPLCEFVLSKEKFIKKYFNRTHCPDETVFQTIANISPYKDNMCNNSMRYIDWTRGGSHPKTLTLEDKEKIENSDKMFARKFDETQSHDLINWVLDKIEEGN